MIDVKDLRVGNWAQNAKGEQYQIENGWQIDEGEELFPILLTEEWLLKFGFELIVFFKYDDNVFYTLDTVGVRYFNDKLYFAYSASKEIKFVHQLQNLYHALTEKELEYKNMTVNG